MRYLLVVDVDGTINQMGQKFDMAKVPTIAPMDNARDVLMKFKKNGAKIVYLTGRSESDFKTITDAWLRNHGFPDPESVIYFQPKHGSWTWENYLTYKQSEVENLCRHNPGFVPLVVDDSKDILERIQNDGCDAFMIRQPCDWLALYDKYVHEAVISQLDDFLGLSTNL